METTRVIIVGAGVGGLTLARYLQCHGISFRIIDRRIGISDDDAAGFSITIQQNGARVLADLCVEPLPQCKILQVNGYLMNFNNPQSPVRLFETRPHIPNYTVPRKALLQKLSESVNVEWNSQVKYVVEHSGIVEVRLADGRLISGLWVIGCDGVHSCIRSGLKLRDAQSIKLCPAPSFTGDTTTWENCFVFPKKVSLPNDPHTELFNLCGISPLSKSNGSVSERYFDGVNRLFTKPHDVDNNQQYWQLTGVHDLQNAEHLQALILNSKNVKQIVLYQTTDFSVPTTVAGRVLLLGDAAHCMCPYKGQGANTAMEDARDLAFMYRDTFLNPYVASTEDRINLAQKYHERILTRGKKRTIDSFLALRKEHSGTVPVQNVAFSIPLTADACSAITSLTLCDQPYDSLPKEVCNLVNLTELTLTNNQLCSVPEEIGALTKLTRLYLRDNKLQSLPNSVGNLTKLRVVRLSGNTLQMLPDSCTNWTNITQLCLSKNNLKKLPQFRSLPKLREFFCTQNPELTRLPLGILVAPKLVIIKIDRTGIRSCDIVGAVNQRFERVSKFDDGNRFALLENTYRRVKPDPPLFRVDVIIIRESDREWLFSQLSDIDPDSYDTTLAIVTGNVTAKVYHEMRERGLMFTTIPQDLPVDATKFTNDSVCNIVTIEDGLVFLPALRHHPELDVLFWLSKTDVVLSGPELSQRKIPGITNFRTYVPFECMNLKEHQLYYATFASPSITKELTAKLENLGVEILDHAPKDILFQVPPTVQLSDLTFLNSDGVRRIHRYKYPVLC